VPQDVQVRVVMLHQVVVSLERVMVGVLVVEDVVVISHEKGLYNKMRHYIC